MAQINTCLKRTFTIFNIFFAIVGGVIIALALLCQILTNVEGRENLEGRTSSLVGLYLFGAITMMVAILGAYGAHKESKASLVVFLVCMIIGTLLMLRAGIPTAIARPQIEGILEQKVQEFLPLDESQPDVQNMANSLQTAMHCCGLFSYRDWRKNIPESCSCNPEEEVGQCRNVEYRNFIFQTKSVYAKPCFPILMHYILLFADILLGIVFTLAILALLGLVLSSIMIHQLRYPSRPTVLLSVPAIFTPAPPKYQELHNPPAY
ncbi:tetraspanin-8-like [Amphiprion ocellaris]|uniref:tetraspanin-8-like n=1 Tax=Amphiprion ocellaris TaxID=80972 RepID=UPI000C30508E|nr:tetraspanin-8-like [Amphiprion ocellaris]